MGMRFVKICVRRFNDIPIIEDGEVRSMWKESGMKTRVCGEVLKTAVESAQNEVSAGFDCLLK